MIDKLKVIYTLVSDQKDCYLEQFYYSAYSVKRVSPNVEIVLVVDDATKRTLVGNRGAEASIADEVISVPYPENMTAKQRSRMLKTTLRECISGDYLSMDADTIAVSPLEDILKEIGEHPIYAVQDLNTKKFSDSPDYEYICTLASKAFSYNICKENLYFNSGVLYVKDNPDAMRFYKLWNKNYITGCANGVSFDQPAFAYTNNELNHMVGELSSGWNCQVCVCDLDQFLNAKIYHYFGGNENLAVSKLNEISYFESIKKTGTLSNEQRILLENPSLLFERTPRLVSNEKDIRFQKSLTYKLCRRAIDTAPFKMTEALLRAVRRIQFKNI